MDPKLKKTKVENVTFSQAKNKNKPKVFLQKPIGKTAPLNAFSLCVCVCVVCLLYVRKKIF